MDKQCDNEVREAAIRDVYGTCEVKNFEEGEAMLESARVELDEALQMLPAGETRHAYDEAVRRCPHLVEVESKPEYFLRALNYNPWEAAERIALYWWWRKDIFGDKAFLPMTLSGDGALSPDDVEAMKCGWVFPSFPADIHNRRISMIDKMKSCPLCEDPSRRLRILFYSCQTKLESHFFKTHGFVHIVAFNTTGKPSNQNDAPPKLFKFLKAEPIPVIKPKAMHLLVIKKRSFLDGVVHGFAKRFLEFLPFRVVVHFSETKRAVLDKLKPYGIRDNNLPTEWGGTLDFRHEFTWWWDDRLVIERERQMLRKVAEPLLKMDAESMAAAAERARAEEAKMRKRQVSLIYQRKKREKFRNDKERLEGQIMSLQREQVELKRDHTLLLALHGQAMEIDSHQKKKRRREQLGERAPFPGCRWLLWILRRGAIGCILMWKYLRGKKKIRNKQHAVLEGF